MSELKLKYEDNRIEIGTDEVGRGCCAGPVVAAAVILDSTFSFPKLRDSKKMSEKLRDEAYEYMITPGNGVVCYAIGVVSPPIIDEINIRNASMKAMHLAVDKVRDQMYNRGEPLVNPLILADGNYFERFMDFDHITIVKGDDKYFPIAAAAVIAKVYRDRLMTKLAEQFPHYLWENNKGYGTEAHLQAIADHGYTVHHRRSYSLNLPPSKNALF